MEKIECINSSSIKEIVRIQNNHINIIYRSSINSKYTYKIIPIYWDELVEFNKKNNGLKINRKIMSDLKQGKKILKIT
ncbi:MAG: hypothetical protein ACRC9U_03350 [Metamycoplasmataceae bacterium]